MEIEFCSCGGILAPAGTGKVKCRNCGKDGLVLTVHKGGVVKYMEVTRKISENFNLEPYLRMRIENLFRTIENSFREKEQSTNTLEEYQAVTP